MPQLWKYQDGRSVEQFGYMERYLDHGGTDHTAFMRRITGELDLVSGSRLKAMSLVNSQVAIEPRATRRVEHDT